MNIFIALGSHEKRKQNLISGHDVASNKTSSQMFAEHVLENVMHTVYKTRVAAVNII